MIFLENQHAVIDYSVLLQGTIDSAAIYPGEIVKATLEHGAAPVILSHNHPSGTAESDKRITNRIIAAPDTIDVRVLDHLIVGGNNVMSFAERGLSNLCCPSTAILLRLMGVNQAKLFIIYIWNAIN